MRTYSAVRDFITGISEVPTGTVIEPGPNLPDVPGRFIVLTRYGGPGEHIEGLMDVVGWQVRVVGMQDDYDDAESIADAIDVELLNIGARYVGSDWVSGVQRAGGSPSPLLKDDAERTHFVCSYLIDTALALIP